MERMFAVENPLERARALEGIQTLLKHACFLKILDEAGLSARCTDA
jgi:hypothetical protein